MESDIFFPLLKRGLWYGTMLFSWWLFGFEPIIVLLLSAIAYKQLFPYS
mgnify:CR=1 FL=1